MLLSTESEKEPPTTLNISLFSKEEITEIARVHHGHRKSWNSTRLDQIIGCLIEFGKDIAPAQMHEILNRLSTEEKLYPELSVELPIDCVIKLHAAATFAISASLSPTFEEPSPRKLGRRIRHTRSDAVFLCVPE